MITLLHISDLHIGATPLWTRSLEPRPATRQPRMAPSWRGHDARVAQDLSNEWARISQAYPETRIVVTGDVTRQGGGLEFGCAHRYVHASWLINPTTPFPVRLGLKAGGDQALTIPGNHDFWNGAVLRSPFIGSRVLGAHFWPVPWLYALLDERNNAELHLVGLNSCSGLRGLSPTQAIALGAIDPAHLHAAEKLLLQAKSAAQARGHHVVRVVLVHHPPKSLTANSQRRLQAWMGRNTMHALLTGHTHIPDVPPQPGRPPFELRCGTTLQAGTRGKLPGPKPNHFYFHRINVVHSQGTRFIWTTYEYWHTGGELGAPTCACLDK